MAQLTSASSTVSGEEQVGVDRGEAGLTSRVVEDLQVSEYETSGREFDRKLLSLKRSVKIVVRPAEPDTNKTTNTNTNEEMKNHDKTVMMYPLRRKRRVMSRNWTRKQKVKSCGWSRSSTRSDYYETHVKEC